jgi:hypothetical protein
VHAREELPQQTLLQVAESFVRQVLCAVRLAALDDLPRCLRCNALAPRGRRGRSRDPRCSSPHLGEGDRAPNGRGTAARSSQRVDDFRRVTRVTGRTQTRACRPDRRKRMRCLAPRACTPLDRQTCDRSRGNHRSLAAASCNCKQPRHASVVRSVRTVDRLRTVESSLSQRLRGSTLLRREKEARVGTKACGNASTPLPNAN